MRRIRSAALRALAGAAIFALAGAALCARAGAAAAATLHGDSTSTQEVTPPPGTPPPVTAPPVPVTRAAEWETLSTGLPEEARFRRIVRLRYNRVDGPALALGAAFQTGRSPAPVLFGEGGYAYSRRKGIYEAGFETPFGDRPLLTLGGSVYRRTATEDEWIVSEGENTSCAVFARTDYRDYNETEGGGAYVSWSPGSDFQLRGR